MITGDDSTGFKFYNIEYEFNNEKQVKKNISLYEKVDSGINFKLKDKYMGYIGPLNLRTHYSTKEYYLSELKHPDI